MYSFSKKSENIIKTLHPDLQLILSELIKVYDFSVIDGLRTTEQQQELYNNGRSKLDGINKKSKHQGMIINNTLYSMAVDIIPYKKNTNPFSGKETDNRRFYYMMGLVKGISIKLKQQNKINNNVRFGLDWDSDDIYDDQTFHDLPHIELW